MGRRTNKANQDESFVMNNETFIDFFSRLKEIAISMFEWINLPPEIDERFLELTLCETGMALFFEDEIAEKYVALTTMIGGPLDIYRIPMYRRAYATNGYQWEGNPDNSVLIFNNYQHTPTFLSLKLYALRLYEIQRTIDVNVKAQKTPVLIRSSEAQRLTMKNAYMQYDGNQPFIFADRNFDMSGFEVLRTDAPYVSDKLYVLMKQIWNDAMGYLGVSNASSEKRERLVTDESAMQFGATEAQRFSRLNARKQAADQINRMFGLNIDVRYRGITPFASSSDNPEIHADEEVTGMEVASNE